MSRGQWPRAIATFLAVAGLAVLTTAPGEAHKPITSPYTFDKDVLPIVRDKCGPCHVAGGVAPMSLMTAADATPWAESIRTELIAGHMPPWPVDAPPGELQNDHRLTGRELNTILTWATGGTPPGDAPAPAAPAAAGQWPLGTPDLELTLDDVMLPAGTQEQVKSFVVATGTAARRMVRAVDLLPGTVAVVRSARIAVKSDAADVPGTPPIERQLALWQPGESPVALGRGIGFELPAGAQLEVTVRYKKTWQYEGKAMQDRSRIGLYFAGDDARPVRAITVRADAPAPRPGVIGGSVAGGRASQSLRLLAVYPDPDMAHVRASVDITSSGQRHADLLALRADPAWARRYWFEQPIELRPGDAWAARFEAYTEIGGTPGTPSSSRALTLDVVTGP